MPNRASNLLAAIGTLALFGAVVVPAVLWPEEFTTDPEVAKLRAVVVGGFLAVVGVVCWIGSVLVKRR